MRIFANGWTEEMIRMDGNGHKDGRNRSYVSLRQIIRMIGVNHTYHLETRIQATAFRRISRRSFSTNSSNLTTTFRGQNWGSASARLSQTVAMDTSESSPKERAKARLSGFQDQKKIERTLIILPMRFYNRLVFSNLQIQCF